MRAIISGSARMDGSSSGGSKGRDAGSAADGGKSAGARGTGRLGVGCGSVVGSKKHPSSCGIRCFLAKTATWLLAWVASLTVSALFCGRGAGCGDSALAMVGSAAATGRAAVAAGPAAVTWVELLAMAGYWLEGRLARW